MDRWRATTPSRKSWVRAAVGLAERCLSCDAARL